MHRPLKVGPAVFAWIVIGGMSLTGWAQTISIESGTLNAGESLPLDVVMDQLPKGLKSYNVEVSIEPASCGAIIETFTLPPGLLGVSNPDLDISADGKRASLAAVDFSENVQAGASNVAFGTVTFRALQQGTSPCTLGVNPKVVSDDQDNSFTPAVKAGTLTVNGLSGGGGGEDTTPPQFTKPQPANGSTIGVAAPVLAVSLQDPSGIDSATIELEVLTGGTSRSFDLSSPGTHWDGVTFSLDLAQTELTLAEGAAQVTVRASDGKGNAGEFLWQFSRTTGGGSPSVEKALDANGNDVLDDDEILRAIQLWIGGQEVPGTGQTINDRKILDLIDLWVRGQPIG